MVIIKNNRQDKSECSCEAVEDRNFQTCEVGSVYKNCRSDEIVMVKKQTKKQTECVYVCVFHVRSLSSEFN